jgi:hypothetical protein
MARPRGIPCTEERKRAAKEEMTQYWKQHEHVSFKHTEEAKMKIGIASLGRHKGRPNISARKVGDLYAEPLHVRVEKGLPILCVVHGEHSDWRANRRNDGSLGGVFCRPCVYESNWKSEAKNYFKTLVSRCKRIDPKSEMTEGLLREMCLNQRNRCALTGQQFDIGKTRKDNHRRMSVDRKDSSLGYTKENVHLVVWPVNHLKNDVPLNEFLELCSTVSVHNTPEYGVAGC